MYWVVIVSWWCFGDFLTVKTHGIFSKLHNCVEYSCLIDHRKNMLTGQAQSRLPSQAASLKGVYLDLYSKSSLSMASKWANILHESRRQLPETFPSKDNYGQEVVVQTTHYSMSKTNKNLNNIRRIFDTFPFGKTQATLLSGIPLDCKNSE